jgi:site-specific DNA-cytosine methylase
MTLVPQKLVDDTSDLPEKSQTIKSQYYKSSKANFERSGTFHATGIPQKLVDVRAMTEVRTPEANQIRYEHKRKTGKDWSPRHMRHLVERPDEKMNTLTSALTKQHILQITEEQEVYWRKLTPLECERLQTVPDNYTNHVSNTQRYKMLGNGWTIEVIAHILQNMEIEQ